MQEGGTWGYSDRLFELRLPPLLQHCFVLRIEKDAMLNVLHREHVFSDLFVEYMVVVTTRLRQYLVDQLFNSAEKRLASDPFIADPLWKEREIGERGSEDKPRDIGRNDRYGPSSN